MKTHTHTEVHIYIDTYTHVKILVNTVILNKQNLAYMLSGIIVTLGDMLIQPCAEDNCNGIVTLG